MNDRARPTAESYSVDWDAFYAALEKCTVRLEQFEHGTPDPNAIGNAMLEVQRKRDIADRIGMKIERRIGELRVRVGVLNEMLSLMEAEVAGSFACRMLPNGERRKSYVVLQTQSARSRLLKAKSRLAEYESARSVVNAKLMTLDRAKETLNAVRRMMFDHK